MGDNMTKAQKAAKKIEDLWKEFHKKITLAVCPQQIDTIREEYSKKLYDAENELGYWERVTAAQIINRPINLPQLFKRGDGDA